MATPTRTRPSDKRFLGNKNKTEVHDLKNEKTNCQVNTFINAGHAVTFSPDTVAQAHTERYDNCAYCIGGSTR